MISRRLTAFLLMCAAFPLQASEPAVRRPDPLFAADKGHHFVVSAAIYAVSYYALRQEAGVGRDAAVTASVGLSFSFGAAKEVYDHISRKGRPSLPDLLADSAGIAVAALLFSLPIHP